jgi:hypothetical protein
MGSKPTSHLFIYLFIHDLCKDAVKSSDCIATNGRTMNEQSIGMDDKVVVAYFTVLPQH